MEQSIGADDIERWILDYIGRAIAVPIERIGSDTSFDALGLDSAAMIDMIGELEEWTGTELDPTMAYDHRDPRKLAVAVALLGPRT